MKIQNLRSFAAAGLVALTAASLVPATVMAQGAPKMTTVRLQDFGTGINTIGALLARTEGLFAKHGIDLKVNPPIFNAAGIANVVMQGQADIGFGGATAILSLVQQNRPVKIIGNIALTFEAEIALTNAVVAKLAQRGITPESRLALRLDALKGLKIGSPSAGSSSDQFVRYGFKKFGLDPARDVILQPLPDLASILGAFRQGAVDGLTGTHGSGPVQVETEKLGRIWIKFQDEDPGLRVAPQHVLFATDDYIKKNPDVIRRMLLAHNDAKKMLRKGITKEQRERVKQQFFRDMKQETYDSLLDGILYITKGPMAGTQEQLDVLLAVHNLAAAQPVKLTFDQVFDTRIAAEVDRM